jgi:hypothetical protein
MSVKRRRGGLLVLAGFVEAEPHVRAGVRRAWVYRWCRALDRIAVHVEGTADEGLVTAPILSRGLT